MSFQCETCGHLTDGMWRMFKHVAQTGHKAGYAKPQETTTQ